MGPFISQLQKRILGIMQEGYKATVRDDDTWAFLYRLGDCDDYYPVKKKTVMALVRMDLIRMNERDSHETDYVVAIDDQSNPKHMAPN